MSAFEPDTAPDFLIRDYLIIAAAVIAVLFLALCAVAWGMN